MILLIDNYDSFTFNLYQYLGEIFLAKGITNPQKLIRVERNDQIDLATIKKINPKAIIISPGPGTPKDAGISIAVVSEFYKCYPILGVCLGHQAIGEAFGAKIVRAQSIMHGKVSAIHHTNHQLFAGIENPFTATRYHSLVIQPQTLSSEFEVIAKEKTDNEIMAIAHKTYPVFGVQFHPESILTTFGKQILANFLSQNTDL